MAHHIYHTEGYVLGTSPLGEANAFIRIYTRDLGLIHATAQGVRLQKSKLKYSLQEFSYSQVSVVRGKEIWRITNARPEYNLFFLFRERPLEQEVVVRILSVLERLVTGEESNPDLFSMIQAAFEFLETNQLARDQIRLFEFIVLLSMLDRLGYGPESSPLTRFADAPLSLELIAEMDKVKTEAGTFIRGSLRESQL